MFRDFKADWSIGAELPQFDEATVKNEPMLFGASLDFAFQHGGPITRAFLDRLDIGGNAIIDSRVHMLKFGWYPAIPGWHLDSIPRSKTNRQPDFSIDTSELRATFALVGDVSKTQFLHRGETIRLWCPDGKRWSEFSRDINSLLTDGEAHVEFAPAGRLIHFGPTDFHRASPATGDGWRMFIRAVSGVPVEHRNEIRKQTQVYLHELEAGW